MSGQGSEREPIDNSKICLVGFSLFVLLGISFSFFWFGSILYGLMLLGLPAMCIVISTYCYMNDEEEESFRVPTYIGTHAEVSEDDHNMTRLADRPPSYRMTWRRSFIKRFRGSSSASPSGVDHEAATEEIHALNALQKDSKPEGGETVVNNSNTTIIVITNEDGDVKELKDDDDAVTQSFNKIKLNLQDSLPNYEEAVIIMKSTENLSTA